MNISWFHISCIPKTDNRPNFTVGGALDHLEHFKHTEQYVNSICFSRIDVCGLPMNEGRRKMDNIKTVISPHTAKYAGNMLIGWIRT